MAKVKSITDAHKELIHGRFRKLVIGASLASVATSLILILIKLVIWIISDSSSMLASLTDSLVDCGASFLNLLALRFALIPADDNHRFGHYKAESLASLTQAAFICGSALLVVFQGISALNSPATIEHADLAILVSIVAMVLTLVLVSFQSYVYKQTKSEAVGADRMHYLSDILFNLGVIAALILAKYGYAWADGVFAIALGLFILKGALQIASNAISVLLDKSLESADILKIRQCILSVPEVVSFHDLKTRVAGPHIYIQYHVILRSDLTLLQCHEIVDRTEKAIMEVFADAEITSHMEPDTAQTFKEVNFLDHTYCEVPRSHYLKEFNYGHGRKE